MEVAALCSAKLIFSNSSGSVMDMKEVYGLHLLSSTTLVAFAMALDSPSAVVASTNGDAFLTLSSCSASPPRDMLYPLLTPPSVTPSDRGGVGEPALNPAPVVGGVVAAGEWLSGSHCCT